MRVTSVQHALRGDTISLTGQIQAKDPINLAFRGGGRLQERSVTVARIPANHYRVVGDFEDHRASGEQRVEAAAWPFLLSLPAVHPMVYGGPTMFHGRVAVLPAVTVVAAPRKVNSDSISADARYEIPNQATSATVDNSGRALRPRRARREQLLHLI
jgi:hypothetical protein